MNWYSYILAFRNIKKFWEFSLLNIIGITVGLSCVILIALWKKYENSFDGFFTHSKNTYLVSIRNSNDPLDKGSYYTPYKLSKLLDKDFPEISDYTHFENYSNFSTCMLKRKSDDDKIFYEKNFCLGDSSFFKIFDFHFTYGNVQNALKEKNSIVLEEHTARKYFGNKNPVGQSLIFNNDKEFTVTGVVQIPDNTQLKFDVLVVNSDIRDPNKLNGWDSNGPSFVQVNNNTDLTALNNKLNKFFKDQKTPMVKGTVVSLIPITTMHTRYGLKQLIFILSSISILILIISLLNYITLSTALFTRRSKQVCLSKISGAPKISISFQYILESVLISYFAAVLSVFVVHIFLPFFNKLNESDINFSTYGSWFESAFGLFVLATIVGIISGLFPSILLALKRPLTLLNASGTNRNKWYIGRRVMVLFQFVSSIFLITVTLFVYKQRNYLEKKPLGFDDQYILKLPINKGLLGNYNSFCNELKNNPHIINITAASAVPAGIGNYSSFRWGPGDENMDRNTEYAIVMPGYTKTFDMKIIHGKPFSFSDPSSVRGLIINKAAADEMGDENPVGRTVNFHFSGKNGTIIGVVNNFQNNFRTREIKPMVLSADPDNLYFLKYIFIKISASDIGNTIHFISKVSKEIAPEYPFEYSFIDTEIDNYLSDVVRFNKIILFFALMAIMLASLGLFGLTLFTLNRKTKEIGIRKVNGARTVEVIAMLNKDFLIWVVIAFIITGPLIWYFMQKWLENFTYKTALSWWIFALAGVLTLIIALLTVSFQSWKAATRNPVEALRYE